MPIRKFHHVGEMEDALWYEPGDPALFAAIARVWDFAERTCQPRFPPGVYKHRSIEAMDTLRETWEEANFQAFHERRKAATTAPK
jgi:hypothetical protein